MKFHPFTTAVIVVTSLFALTMLTASIYAFIRPQTNKVIITNRIR